MAIEVTLTLPENLVEHAKRFGSMTRRDVNTVLADALEMMWPALGHLPENGDYPPISSLTDADVLHLADMKMEPAQHRRLTELQARGKREELAADERYELLALMQIYQLKKLRKSEALSEAVQRGLRKPAPA